MFDTGMPNTWLRHLVAYTHLYLQHVSVSNLFSPHLFLVRQMHAQQMRGGRAVLPEAELPMEASPSVTESTEPAPTPAEPLSFPPEPTEAPAATEPAAAAVASKGQQLCDRNMVHIRDALILVLDTRIKKKYLYLRISTMLKSDTKNHVLHVRNQRSDLIF